MSRHGSFHGRIHGAKHGARHNDKIGGGISVQLDGGVYFPASSADFLALGLSAPNSLWPLQEASGSMVDTISGINLTVVGTPTYAAAVPGFSTVKGLTMTEVGNQRATNTTTAPNTNTTSCLLLALAYVPAAASAAARTMIGNSLNNEIQHNTSDRLIGRFNGASVAQVVDPGGFRFLAHQIDRTNSVARFITDQASSVGTYNVAITGIGTGIGQSGATPSPTQYLRMWQYSGAAAEISAAQIKAIGQALGVTFAW
jgi:hypothetical protein